MTMSLLAIVQEFSLRTGLDKPAAVMTSGDSQPLQIAALANEVISDLMNRGKVWPRLQKTAVFPSVTAEIQAPLSTIAPYGYNSIIADTLFDRTERRPLYGPRGNPRWEESIALPTTGPFYSWRVYQGNFCLQPNPPAGHTLAFEYTSDWSILDVDGVTWKPRFTKDTDVFQLSEDLLLAGLRWKWKYEKGLRCQAEQLAYESMLAQKSGNDSTKGELSMDGCSNGDIRPGIYVPLGNWTV